jgi:uncharacterized membrane protein YgaE (UPF0421/DUF939 family)
MKRIRDEGRCNGLFHPSSLWEESLVATVQFIRGHEKLSTWDFFYALDMAIACLLSYSIITSVLSPFVVRPDAILGGMWAAVATVFVFRETRASSLVAGISRLIATCVSFALCLAYLVIFPFHPVGLAALLGIGTVIMMYLGRRDDIVTTGITTVVVMVVAAMSPQDAWHQPLFRLADTVVGIAVGVACKWVSSFLYYRPVGRPAR